MPRSLHHFLSKHGLAIACVVAPLVFGLWGSYLTVAAMMHAGHVETVKLDYRFRDQLLPSAAPASQSAPVSAEREAEKIAAERATARMDLVARHYSGIVNLALASCMIYFVALVSVVAGAFYLSRHFRRSVVVLIVFTCFAVAAGQSVLLTESQHRRLLVTGNILRLAETHDALKDLPMLGPVNTLIAVDIFIGIAGVLMLFASVYVATIRSDRPDLPGLKERLFVMRAAMVLGSALLVAMVLFVRGLGDWPLSLLTEAQKVALSPAADALVRVWGSAATIALIGLVVPAVISWHLDRAVYRHGQGESGAPVADGLEIAPLSTASGLLTVLAPLVASPLLDVVKSTLSVVSGH